MVKTIGRSFILLIMAWWIYAMIITRTPYTFIDNVNLLFHEGGHLVFGIFGEFIGFLGGSIMQLLLPFILSIYFLRRSEWFEMAFCFFWMGENFINVAYYISDAQTQLLPLLGGGIHDWNWILGRLGMLQSAVMIGTVVFWLGAIMMILTFLGGGYVTYKEWSKR